MESSLVGRNGLESPSIDSGSRAANGKSRKPEGSILHAISFPSDRNRRRRIAGPPAGGRGNTTPSSAAARRILWKSARRRNARPFAAGVDLARAGWIVAAAGPSGKPTRIELAASAAGAARAACGARLILCDLPIGFPRAGSPLKDRPCDVEARSILGRRACTVFRVPSREALEAEDRETASRIEFAHARKRVTAQLWNLRARILELDRFLREERRSAPLRESHPELCFTALAGGVVPAHPKRTQKGRDERLAILESAVPGLKGVALETVRSLPAGVRPDDVLDALALAAAASMALRFGVRTLPALPPRDATGLPMEIVLFAPRESAPPRRRGPRAQGMRPSGKG